MVRSPNFEVLTADNLNDYLSSVNGVIGICKDAEEGFRGAANLVKDPNLKAMFEEYSEQRAEFANELRAATKTLVANRQTQHCVIGTLHHGWIPLKGVLTGHSEHLILEETERGEAPQPRETRLFSVFSPIPLDRGYFAGIRPPARRANREPSFDRRRGVLPRQEASGHRA